ncbi:ABC transporter permease [Clostridium ragsdalei]|nr:ABC transporter permease [Clostridium ragsdalei]
MKRILQIIPMLIVVSIVAFTLSNLSTGSAAEITIMNEGGQVNTDTVAAVNKELELDKPLYIQYFSWLGRVCHLNLGLSYRSKQPVLDEIMYRFPATLNLALCATALSILIAVPMAIISAKYKNKWIDHFLGLFLPLEPRFLIFG